MTEEQVREAVRAAKGKIFSVLFVKKDGTLRKMVCRTGVTKHLKGGELPYDPIEKGLLGVFDMAKQEYRMINLRTIQSISLEVEDAPSF
jgi:hypothetical protein